ncbi:MAG: response regulator transcription factor [Spirochaetaceae bacterium]|nr:response regulator transcription factor [Spirochaetaceae bacterium]
MYIQIVEDDKALSDGIEITLSDGNTEFKKEYTVKDAASGFKDYGGTLSLIILDINLPDGTGYDYLKIVRAQSSVPVLILTANDMELDEVKGLTMGADDYLTKPFSLAVLRARVNALVRRSRVSAMAGFSADSPGSTAFAAGRVSAAAGASVSQGGATSVENSSSLIYKIDDMVFDFGKLTFKRNGEEIFLSVNEQRLLKLFLENKGCVLTRERLMERLWGEDGTFVDENTLSVTINRLRSKVDGGKGAKHISTIYGQGYRFD